MVPTAAIRRGVFAALLAAASKKAGEGTGELRVYPWGNWLRDERLCSGIPAPIDQSQIGCTSVAGIFPHGVAACGAQDMAGNMWAWCCTPYVIYPLPDEMPPHTASARQD